MPSIIEGYNYDIFISYRQKDNKYDGWVTEFVDNLKKELEATFKEDISVYFDVNPHDGLLETHDVDASLKDKLKCLVFIPIVSRTYCDPKSFAWEHEFKAFIDQASNDRFGLMIKLPNGNVANRILPVRIHDLESDDLKMCESLTGSYLRGIEFIYKEPGVNRPLRSNEEYPNSNLNHTIYRNQVNKVANAIQEIIQAIRHPEGRTEFFTEKEMPSSPVFRKNNLRKAAGGIIIILVLLTAGLFLVPGVLKQGKNREKSIAVLPFYSMSADTVNQYLADGMMDAILTHLSRINDIRVISRTSVEQYRKTIKTTSEIGKELNVGYILEGSFQRLGDSIRLIAQLIKTGEEGHVWASIYDRHWENVFSVQSEVAGKIASELKGVLSPEDFQKMTETPTKNLSAYQAYLRGRYFVGQPHFSLETWKQATSAFQEATGLDTTFALAWGELARCHARFIYMKTDMSDERMKLAEYAASKALELGGDNPRVHIAIGYYYLYAFRDKPNALKHLEIAEKGLPNDYDVLFQKAVIIATQGKWYENIELLEKAAQISPNTVAVFSELAESYWLTRQYEKCFEASDKANALAPADSWPYLYRIFATWSATGSAAKTRDVVEQVSKKSEWYVWTKYFQLIGERKFSDALEFVSDTTGEWLVNNKVWAYPRPMLMAMMYEQLGDKEQAATNYEAARVLLEKQITIVSKDPRYHSTLGLVYAAQNKKDEAIKEGLLAVELLPISLDALYGCACVEDLSLIYIKVGEFDMALDQLEKLLEIPSWVTLAWTKFDYRFDPLLLYPRYQNLAAKYAVD